MSEKKSELTNEEIRVTIRLLDQEYIMKCDVNERLLFENAGVEFDRVLRHLREKKPNYTEEKLYQLAGLTITLTLLKERRAIEEEIHTTNRILEKLGSNLDQTINDG